LAAVQLHILSFVLANDNEVVVVFVFTAKWVGISKITKMIVMYQFLDQDLLHISENFSIPSWWLGDLWLENLRWLVFFFKYFISFPPYLHYFTIFPHSHVFICHWCFIKLAVGSRKI